MFVNCAFDDGFRSSVDAIVFTCVHAGFLPWMAGSTGTIAVPRVERILEGLMSCRYSIHDLTRYQGEGPHNLSRFNMPLELGMAMALRGVGSTADRHDWMVMVPIGHVFREYISDLAGFDPAAHDGTQANVALAVLRWLMTRPTVPAALSPMDVLPKLPEYSARKRELDERWGDTTPWGLVIDLALEIVQD